MQSTSKASWPGSPSLSPGPSVKWGASSPRVPGRRARAASGPLSSLPLSLPPGVAAAFREAMMTRALTDSLSPRATRQSHIPTPRGLGWASSGRGRGVCRQAGPRPATACRRERGPAPGGGPGAVRGSPGLARSTEQLLSPVARVTEGFFFASPPFPSWIQRAYYVPGTSDAFFSVFKTTL